MLKSSGYHEEIPDIDTDCAIRELNTIIFDLHLNQYLSMRVFNAHRTKIS